MGGKNEIFEENQKKIREIETLFIYLDWPCEGELGHFWSWKRWELPFEPSYQQHFHVRIWQHNVMELNRPWSWPPDWPLCLKAGLPC